MASTRTNSTRKPQAAEKLQRLLKSQLDPPVSAQSSGLNYVSDDAPGYRRVRRGKSFHYVKPDGKPLKDEAELHRIRSLVLPPAWKSVWICTDPTGHLQATGIDARGRKQYRYHPLWRQVRDQAKYSRILTFGKALPRIRERVESDLRQPGLGRTKVLATVVRLLETTLIRVGNQEYARSNKSFGLTTMHDRHVQVDGCKLNFNFRGKSGKFHSVDMENCELADAVKKCREVPGQELFQYVDGAGRRRTVSSGDVNAYLKEIAGRDFTAKDFRTWAGTVLAAMALREVEHAASARQANKNVVRAIESVARRLGNTPSICRKCYVHPEIIESYLDGTLAKTVRRKLASELSGTDSDLGAEERWVMKLLRQRLTMAASPTVACHQKTKTQHGNGSSKNKRRKHHGTISASGR